MRDNGIWLLHLKVLSLEMPLKEIKMKLDSLVALSRGLNPACPQSSAAKWCANDCSDAQVNTEI